MGKKFHSKFPEMNFIGQTLEVLQLVLQPDVGKHILTVYDMEGEKKQVRFEIVGTRESAN